MEHFEIILLLVIIFFHINQHLKLSDMANSIADLTAQVDELQASLDSEQEQIKAAIQQLQDAIDQLNADNGSPEDRQALADKLTAIKSDLQSTVPPVDGGTTPTP
jgi:chromosome segregation ATPase